MALEKKFMDESIMKIQMVDYLKGELKEVGFSGALIQSTPIATRIIVKVQKPGRVIGKKGSSIQKLIDTIKDRFGVPNPLIDVVSVDNPNLDAPLVADKIKNQIETGRRVRQLIYSAIRTIMKNGAIGCEIVIKGKIVGKSGRARGMRVSQGYLPKAGEPASLVKTAKVVAYPKAGAVGITVKIVLPDTVFPDKVNITPKKEETPKVKEVHSDGNIQNE